MVKVRATSTTNIINVQSETTSRNVVTGDAINFYAQLSKQWAISDKLVEGLDYSSKHYANEAKSSAETAEAKAEISSAKAEEVIETAGTALSDIQTSKNQAIANIESSATTAESTIDLKAQQIITTADTALNDIQTSKTGALTEIAQAQNAAETTITTKQNNAITAITESQASAENSIAITKNNAISDIQTESTTQIDTIQAKGQEQIDNIEQTGFFMQNGKLYYIDENGETQEFKSGSGLEVCDIGMALYIDESKGLRRHLNGQIVVNNTNTSAFVTKLQSIIALHPSLARTESQWQAAKTLSAFGQVGKFVLNYAEDGTTVESVRLPAVVNVQGLFDLSKLGMTVSAGLPTLTTNSTGAHYHLEFNSDKGTGDSQTPVTENQYPQRWGNGGYSSYVIGGSSNVAWVGRSSTAGAHTHIISGTSNTVQEEAIQYPYFIQIATGVEEENIINNYKVANPYFYGYSIYSKTNPENTCWLQSSGQWNSGTVYTGVYEWAVTQLNSGVSGFKAAGDSTVADSDWVVDTANTQFRFPLKNGQEGMFSNSTVPSGWNLYYYIGNVLQNPDLVNIARIEEELTTKLDITQKQQITSWGFPSGKGVKLTVGPSGTTYTAPASGWFIVRGEIPQSGYISGSSGSYTDFTQSSAKGIIVPSQKGAQFSLRYQNATFNESYDGITFVYALGGV